MPWEKYDALPGNLADHDRRRRLPVGRLDVDLLRVVEQRVEARPSEDADLGLAPHRPSRGNPRLAREDDVVDREELRLRRRAAAADDLGHRGPDLLLPEALEVL